MNDNTIHFCLYVAGESPNSRLAIANLKALCQKHLPDQHHIEIVDVFTNPKRALQDGAFLTPMLVILGTIPPITIIGNLSQPDPILQALALEETMP